MRKISWLLLSVMGWMLLLGCSAETAAPTAIPPTAVPPTDVPATAIPPTESPATAISATEAPTTAPVTIAAATIAAVTEAPAAAEPEGIFYNGYANVLYTQDDFDLLSTGERIKLVNVYGTW